LLLIGKNQNKGDMMDILKSIKSWSSALADVGVSLLALGIVLEILFNGQGIPFWPNISVIGNIQGLLGSLSSQGLIGLVAVWILYNIYKNK
tara:strand:+ start:889 stop:1161 length:273 start_codon:yes stop_codon:yes gene_type:complete